ncbi:MAG: hypothetical protein LBD96_03745 [Treponema sp.]|jgi:hypothetical protein|nr:hypothetical protein [Treponema sp.]
MPGRSFSGTEEILPPLSHEGERRLLPALLGALASVFLIRSGLLGILFMVPLGVVGFSFGRRTAWTGALLAVLFNTICALALSLFSGQFLAEFFSGVGYFFLMTLAFTWLVAPPREGPGILRIRAAYRLILGALAGALAGLGFTLGDSLDVFMQAQAELISSMAVASAGADAVRRSLLEQELSPERLMALFNTIQIRGGLLGSMMAIFFINRQLSLAFAAFMGRRQGHREGEDTSLMSFHVPARLIWVFSLSLGGILISGVLGLSLPETLAWNCVTFCVLMYLAQGFGIVRFFLSRRPAGRRLLFSIGIILVIVSPGINTIALGLLILLGIAEHWAPLRVVRDRPPPTPVA